MKRSCCPAKPETTFEGTLNFEIQLLNGFWIE